MRRADVLYTVRTPAPPDGRRKGLMSEGHTAPRLIFPPASTKVGRPYSIADHWEVSPRVACRELIQNSLDAYAASPSRGGGALQSLLQDRPAKRN